MGNTLTALELIDSEQRQQKVQIAQEEAEAARIETTGKHPLLQDIEK